MSAVLPVFPVATASQERLADWMELYALQSADGNSSFQDLVQVIRRSATAEALPMSDSEADQADAGSELSQEVAERALSEIDNRVRACGEGTEIYPFDNQGEYIQLRPGGENSVYMFELLLTHFGIGAGPKKIPGARLFEDLSAKAAESYLGGASLGARARNFGFPRRILPAGFKAALAQLCQELGEGSPNEAFPKFNDQKDGKLDLVAWRDFADRKPGKLIAFGQCAAGDSQWVDKAKELDVRGFCKMWLRDPILVDPMKMFFVPWCVERDDWPSAAIFGGILFDRCRIAHHATLAWDDALKAQCHAWSSRVLKRLRK